MCRDTGGGATLAAEVWRLFCKALKPGGSQLDYGDMSLELLPFPRAPVVLIVWTGDEEFPSNASLLLDRRCTAHLPIDVLWSTAMTAIEMMVINANTHE